jgi:hypothetical protein
MTAMVAAVTAAETEDTKTTALIDGVIDCTLEALCFQSPVSPGQRQALAVLKAEALAEVATISAEVYDVA